MKCGGGLARNIDFEVANFQLLLKTRRKTSIFVLQLVKIEGGLARNARFGAVTRVIACLWLRRVYGGSCRNVSVSWCHKSRGFPLASQCLWLKLQKRFFFNLSDEVEMSFRGAGVALCESL